MKLTLWRLFPVLTCGGWLATHALAQSEGPTISAPAVPATTTTSTPAPAATTTTTSDGVVTLPPPNNTVSGTVSTYNITAPNGEVNLTEEQKEKLRAMLKRAQLNDEQKKRQAELLDKTPVLEDKINPGMTEKGSIPKRF